MRPAVELAYYLIIRNDAVDDDAHDLVGRQARDAKVSRAAEAVLAGVFAANGIVDSLGSEAAVDEDRLIVEQRAHFLQQSSKPAQIGRLLFVGRVIELTMLGKGQFFEGEMLSKFQPGVTTLMSPAKASPTAMIESATAGAIGTPIAVST